MAAPAHPNWLVENKEAIAAVGVLLGIVPRLLDLWGETAREHREERRLSLARQRLELTKLQYEVDQLQHAAGAPPPRVAPAPAGPAPETAPAATAEAEPARVVPPPAEPARVPAGEGERPRLAAPIPHRPGWVDWLLAHPAVGRPTLWIGQMWLGFMLVTGAFVAVGFPFSMFEPETRKTFGLGEAVGIEVVYVLMVIGFGFSYRNVRDWRRRPPRSAGPPASPAGAGGR